MLTDMRALALVLIALTTCATPQAVRVIDGDTIALGEETIRIENLDAPEMPGRADCDLEASLALRSKSRLEGLIASGRVTLRRNKERPQDFYGRTLAIVLVDGRDVAETMVAEGLARPWRGRSSDWCA